MTSDRAAFIGSTAGAALGTASGIVPRLFAQRATGAQNALAKPALALNELKATGPFRAGDWGLGAG